MLVIVIFRIIHHIIMFYLYSNEVDSYLDGGNGKEGNIKEDDLGFPNKVLLLNSDSQDFTSCYFQDYSKYHDVT